MIISFLLGCKNNIIIKKIYYYFNYRKKFFKHTKLFLKILNIRTFIKNIENIRVIQGKAQNNKTSTIIQHLNSKASSMLLFFEWVNSNS